ncbi:MAG: hypothetical protein HY508_15280 [Acidobacteria bacterium]|nr:hypothetical protein [Acidobacteriota bacterium]
MSRILTFALVSASKAPISKESENASEVSFSPMNNTLPMPSRHPTRSTSSGPNNRPLLDIPLPRCSVKGCIFPAASVGGSLCLIHHLAEKEPTHFLSVQPSALCLDRAKYGIAESDFDDSRARDRRQLSLQLDRLRDEVA